MATEYICCQLANSSCNAKTSFFFFLKKKDEDKETVTEKQLSPQVPWCLKDEPNILLNAFSRKCLIYGA